MNDSLHQNPCLLHLQQMIHSQHKAAIMAKNNIIMDKSGLLQQEKGAETPQQLLICETKSHYICCINP